MAADIVERTLTMERERRERLKRLFEDPGLSRLLSRLEQRVARGSALTGSLLLTDATEGERTAIGKILGRLPKGRGTVTLSLRELDRALAASGLVSGLDEAVRVLLSEVAEARESRLQTEQAWNDVLKGRAARPLGPFASWMGPAPGRWLDAIWDSGLLKRLAQGDAAQGARFLQACEALVALLPAEGMPLAELAARAAGDSHALDVGRPLATLMSSLLGMLESQDDRLASEASPEEETRRDLWARVGILVDELSAPALVLNLRSSGDGLLSQALALHAAAGEPYRISTRLLVRHPPIFHPSVTGPRVFVTENPNVVAAAANRLGPRAAPLISTEGQEKTSVRMLLNHLASSGIDILYHGDFDWPGLRIGGLVMRRHQARPWRFSAADYRQAAGQVRAPRPLAGKPCEATWDAELAADMRRLGVAVDEEMVLGDLLRDLAPSS